MSSIFITFEGLDGVGKSVIVKEIIKWLKTEEIDFLQTREPSDLIIGKEIRELLLNPKFNLSSKEQTYFFIADRIQHFLEEIKPALENNKLVICDRYHDSTIGYQSNQNSEKEEFYAMYNKLFLKPDLTFFIEAASLEIANRLDKRAKKNVFDNKSSSFFAKLQENYDWIYEREKKDQNQFQRIHKINNDGELASNVRKIIDIITSFKKRLSIF